MLRARIVSRGAIGLLETAHGAVRIDGVPTEFPDSIRSAARLEEIAAVDVERPGQARDGMVTE